MRIIDLDIIRVKVNARGDWLFVHLQTDEGVTGLGEASQGADGPDRDAMVTAILTHQCRPILAGKDPRAVVAATEALQPVADGVAGATAVSACEQALWDLAGKAAGQPVYRLLGGPVRDQIPLYANINRATSERTPAGFATSAAGAVRDGFQAIKCAPFEGMARQRLGDRDQRQRIANGVACVAAIRDAVGAGIDLYVDCHSHFDVPSALAVAAELRALGVRWLEEPVPTTDLDALRQVRARLTGMELIGGERLYGLDGFWPYLAAGVWDVIMPDVKHCGGIAAAHQIGALATAHGVQIAPHNPSGPVATIASAHVAAAMLHLRALEYAWGEVPWRADLIAPPERIEHGALLLPPGPGLGIALDPAVVAAHAR